jgi:hypothetical protein
VRERVEVYVTQPVQFRARDDRAPHPADPDLAGDLGGGRPVVTSGDTDPDPGVVSGLDGLLDPGPRRSDHGDEPDQREPGLCVRPRQFFLRSDRGGRAEVESAPSDGKHPQSDHADFKCF